MGLKRLHHRLFLEHPRNLGEGYMEHASAAVAVGALMVAGGVACLIHAIIPAFFRNTASRQLESVNRSIAQRRRQHTTALETRNGATETGETTDRRGDERPQVK